MTEKLRAALQYYRRMDPATTPIVPTAQPQCAACRSKFDREPAVAASGTFSFGASSGKEVQFLCPTCSRSVAEHIVHLRSKSDWYSAEYD